MEIVVSTNDDGFLAKCSGMQGAFAEGDTPYEALYNLMDVLHLISSYKGEQFDRAYFQKGISFRIPEFA